MRRPTGGSVRALGWRTASCCAALATALAVASAGPTFATTVPDGFVHEQLVGEPFQGSPVAFDFLDADRFVLVEQTTGIVRVAAAGSSSSDSVFTIPDVRADQPERGLLGVCRDPQWPARPFLYFHYTAVDSTVKIVMYEARGDLVEATSADLTLHNRYVLLDDIDDLDGAHNAGTLRFAPDGMLIVSVGDDVDQACAAQDLTSPLGKLLRLDVSAMPGPGSGPPPLTSLDPGDNPFPGGTGYQPLVLAWGLRNPFRFTVDAPTGDIFIGSVGWKDFEEINRIPGPTYAGLNFGWPQMEGDENILCPCGTCGQGNVFTAPIHGIPHPLPLVSVIGGAVLRPSRSPNTFPASYKGDYLFVEFYSGDMFRLHREGATWDLAAPVPGQPDANRWGAGFAATSDVQRGADGAIYLVSLGFNPAALPRGLHRIRSDSTAVPPTVDPPRERLTLGPNPSHGEAVTIRYHTSAPGTVEILVSDSAGRVVARFHDEAPVSGNRSFVLDSRTFDGQRLAAGIYLIHVRTPSGRELVGKLTWIP